MFLALDARCARSGCAAGGCAALSALSGASPCWCFHRASSLPCRPHMHSENRVLVALLPMRQVMDIVSSFHQLWSLPFQVAITLYLLYRQVYPMSIGCVLHTCEMQGGTLLQCRGSMFVCLRPCSAALGAMGIHGGTGLDGAIHGRQLLHRQTHRAAHRGDDGEEGTVRLQLFVPRPAQACVCGEHWSPITSTHWRACKPHDALAYCRPMACCKPHDALGYCRPIACCKPHDALGNYHPMACRTSASGCVLRSYRASVW